MLKIRINKTFCWKRFDKAKLIFTYLQHPHLFKFVLHSQLLHFCIDFVPLNPHLHSEHLGTCFFTSSILNFHSMLCNFNAAAFIFSTEIFTFLSPRFFFIIKSTFFTLEVYIIIFLSFFHHILLN